jgi:hypothetical protein
LGRGPTDGDQPALNQLKIEALAGAYRRITPRAREITVGKTKQQIDLKLENNRRTGAPLTQGTKPAASEQLNGREKQQHGIWTLLEQKGNIGDETKSETRNNRQKRNQPSDDREWWWQRICTRGPTPRKIDAGLWALNQESVSGGALLQGPEK